MNYTTDFFANQDKARKSTAALVVYFLLAVIAIVAVIYLIIAIGMQSAGFEYQWRYGIFNETLFAAIAFITTAIIAGGTLLRLSQFSGPSAGRKIAELMGGKKVDPSSSDLQERTLLNVVEEMAIASGVPVPPVYVMDETGINAFAAGFSINDAVVAVTRGSLDLLSRDELQGVIAHEFSHIFNGDMRLNLRLISVLHGILILALTGSLILRMLRFSRTPYRTGSRSDSKKGGGGGVIVALIAAGVAFTVVGSIGEFFARLIQRAVSRQREFLADASAVQFTRNPSGIAGALKKIGGFSGGSSLKSSQVKEMNHLFFAEGLKSGFSSLMSTHPDLATRIRRIDPSFDGTFAPVRKASGVPTRPEPKNAAPPTMRPIAPGVLPEALTRIGTISTEMVVVAGALLDSMPQEFRESAREAWSARAVVFALLIDNRGDISEMQYAALREYTDQRIISQTRRLVERKSALSDAHRLALLELVMPALDQMSQEQYKGFLDAVDALIRADSAVTVHEFVVRRFLRKQFERIHESNARRASIHSIREVRDEIRLVLSALAWQESEGDRTRAEAAFQAGIKPFAGYAVTLSLADPEEIDFDALDPALAALARTIPLLKKTVLEACVACVVSDRSVTVTEFELVRAVAETLDIPIPPFAYDA